MQLESACDYRSVQMLEEAVAAAQTNDALMAWSLVEAVMTATS